MPNLSDVSSRSIKGYWLCKASFTTIPNKTSLRSTNIALDEDPSTISASKSKDSSFKDNNNNTTPFASVQDNMKELNSLIKGILTNLFKGFEEEGILDTKQINNNNKDDTHALKLKKKLKVTKEAYRFAKEINDNNYATQKLKTILKLENEIKNSYNN